MRKLLFVFLLIPTLANAQYVANPTRVEFVPSTDHTVVLPDGTQMVQSYEFRIYLKGAAQPFSKTNLGKPTPVSGIISIGVEAAIIALPISSTTEYTARVAAIGGAGEGESVDSNFFGRVGNPAVPGNVKVAK